MGLSNFVTAAWIDSHVHVVYSPAGPQMLDGGVAVAVDHAAPVSFFKTDFGDLTVIGSGPMITAPGGYPLASWGKDGYGIAVTSPETAMARCRWAIGRACWCMTRIPGRTRRRWRRRLRS